MLEDELLTIEEVAAYLKLRPQTIYKWAQQKRIPGAKFGKEWRFKRSEIVAWVNRRMGEGEGEGDGAAAGAGGRIAGGKDGAASAATDGHGAQEHARRGHRARGARKRKEVGPQSN